MFDELPYSYSELQPWLTEIGNMPRAYLFSDGSIRQWTTF
jgi:hypothetical protein